MIEWVKIEEGCKLPKSHTSVLIAHGSVWEEGYFDGKQFGAYCPDDGDIYHADKATHWAEVNLPDGN